MKIKYQGNRETEERFAVITYNREEKSKAEKLTKEIEEAGYFYQVEDYDSDLFEIYVEVEDRWDYESVKDIYFEIKKGKD